MKTVAEIVALHGGLDALAAKPIKVLNEPYTPLNIEVIGHTQMEKRPVVAVSHSYVQNGDVMFDPEITFAVGADDSWSPRSFRQDGLGINQEVERTDESGLVVRNERMARDLAAFARTWDRNLREQGFLDAYRTSRRATGNQETQR